MNFVGCCWIEEKYATNQGVVGSIPASRTKNKSLQRKLQAFSFVRQLFVSWAGALNAILTRA
jgi:hypothetical protein